MSSSTYFVADDISYERIRSIVSTVVDTNTRLPNSPFKKSWALGGFDEMDWAISGPFWPYLQTLASESGDESVILAVLEPDPVLYFKRNYGFYYWVEVPKSATERDYWDVISSRPTGEFADSLLVNGQVIVITVPSCKWAIWCERNWEIIVLASVIPDLKGVLKDFDWLKDFSYCNNAEWQSFVEALRQNLQPNLGLRQS